MPPGVKSLYAEDNKAHCSDVTVLILESDQSARYFGLEITWRSEEQGASKSILSKHSVWRVHQVEPSLQETVIRSAICGGMQLSTERESLCLRSGERSFEERRAWESILEARTIVFPPGAAHKSRIFSAPSRGRQAAAKTLAESRK